MRNFRGGQMKLFDLRQLDDGPDVLSFQLLRENRTECKSLTFLTHIIKVKKQSFSQSLPVYPSLFLIPFYKACQLLSCSRFSCPLFTLNETTIATLTNLVLTHLNRIQQVLSLIFIFISNPACSPLHVK